MAPKNPAKPIVRRLPRDQRVAAILLEARNVLQERGSEQFLASEVAERCGISEGTIYKYFPTKRDLFLAAVGRCFAKIGEISRWRVIGNADATERDGERLARDRAQTVIDALVARGVSRNSLDGVGVGATDPADERRTPDARAKNRRVELMPIRQAR